MIRTGIGTHIKNRFKKMSLVQKFSSAVIFLIIVTMMITNYLIVAHQKKSLRAELENNHFVLAEKLAKDVVEPLIFKDPLRLDELVRTTAQTPACIRSGIFDKDMKIVAHTDRKLLGGRPADSMNKQLSAVMSGSREYTISVSGDNVKEILVPVRAGYEYVGAVAVGFSNDAINAVIENNLKGLKKYILLVSFAVMLAGVWGAFGLARLLATPIKKLRGRMEAVQIGNLNVDESDDNVVYCHEVLGCGRQDCPAYGKKKCWAIEGTKCSGCGHGEVFEKVKECRKCIVYRESCGDEIGELVEVFNQMIKKLKESINELEESNRERSRLEKLSALGEMSMTMAHEIKNPLNSIRGAASYLRNNFEGEVLKEFLSVIEDESRRLNEIVTSILRYSRPTPLNLQLSDINKVVKETVELVRQEATDNNVEVIMHLDEKISFLKLDPQQIKQAFLNMLVNSLDATKAGDTIKISTEAFDSRVRVMIKDTGAGISEEAVTEIFKPFFTTKTRGSGLGLACVERIVKDHKGDVFVKSRMGEGTEFIITLPA